MVQLDSTRHMKLHIILSARFFFKTNLISYHPQPTTSVNMQPFLRQYGASIRFKTIFGLCPFVVTADDKFVRVSTCATTCTTIVVIIISLGYPYLTWSTLDGMVFDELSGTRAITAMLEHIIVAAVFLAILIASLVNRVQQTRFLNSFSGMYDRWMNASICRRNVRRLFVKNAVLYGLYFLCNVVLIFLIWNELENWQYVVYNLLYIFAMMTELQAVFHVRDFALLLSDAFAECADRMNNAMLQESSDYETEFVSELEDVKCDFDQCFGLFLLLFQLKDFLFMTSVVFFAVVEFFFKKEDYSWTVFFFMVAFYVPVLAKNVWLVRTVDGLEQNVCTSECLKKKPDFMHCCTSF